MILRPLIDPLYEKYLTMQCRQVPNHIAIIQDGNRRYAKMLGIDTPQGHRAGADKTEEMLDWTHELGIRHITLYTFSEVDEANAQFLDQIEPGAGGNATLGSHASTAGERRDVPEMEKI